MKYPAGVVEALLSTKQQGEVRILGGVPIEAAERIARMQAECGSCFVFCPWGVMEARDSPKVADQVRLLAGTLSDEMTLEPDG